MNGNRPSANRVHASHGLLRKLPWTLIVLRVAVCPLLVLDAADGSTSAFFVPIFLVGFLSDVFDGILARRFGVESAALRTADSRADVALYATVAASAWLTHREALIDLRGPLLSVVALQVLSWIVDRLKYGTLVLPTWTHDVKSFAHAIRIARRG